MVEIYPRLLMRKVIKSSVTHRTAYITAHYPDLDDGLSQRAAASEDAFDAAVSALVMAQHVDELTNLTAAPDRQAELEGLIWQPPLPLA